jgi:SAM-dependent methyltransferase
MPLPPGSVDLIISRGAMWFWEKERSLREIWRVLAPAGAAVIGGGYGNPELKAAVFSKMSALNGEDWSIRQKKMVEGASPEDYALVLDRLVVDLTVVDLPTRSAYRVIVDHPVRPAYQVIVDHPVRPAYRVIHDESGDWLLIRKAGGAEVPS